MPHEQSTRRLLLIASAVLAVACAAPNDDQESAPGIPPGLERTHWDCGGRVLTVAWERHRAFVTFGGRTWRLARAVSGSGARYASAEGEVWEHQGKVRWTAAGKPALTCPRIGGK